MHLSRPRTPRHPVRPHAVRSAVLVAVLAAAFSLSSASPASAVPLLTCTGGTGSYIAGPTPLSPTGVGMQGQVNFTNWSGGYGGATAVMTHRSSLPASATCPPVAPPQGTVIGYGYASGSSGSFETGEYSTTSTAGGGTSQIFTGTSIYGPVTFTSSVTGVTCNADGTVSFTTSLISPLTVG
jgi:hypothetical protein